MTISPRNSNTARAPDGESDASWIYLRAAHEARARLAQIGRHADRQLAALAGRRVEQVQVAGLLVDDLAAAGGGVQDREVGVPGELLDRLRLRVVRVQVELAVAVGAEVDRVADPHRIGVVARAAGCGIFSTAYCSARRRCRSVETWPPR